MKAIIQIQYQSWEKEERGGKWAQDRSSLPKEKEISIDNLFECKDNIYIDFISKKKRIRNQIVNKYLKIDDLSFLITDKGLEVRNLQIQKPNDGHKLIKTVTLNSWFRIIYNRRVVDTNHGEYSRWYYESNILNIGFYKEIDSNSFINSKPEKVVDLRKDLYKLGRTKT